MYYLATERFAIPTQIRMNNMHNSLIMFIVYNGISYVVRKKLSKSHYASFCVN
jgi:hypothetical protein